MLTEWLKLNQIFEHSMVKHGYGYVIVVIVIV